MRRTQLRSVDRKFVPLSTRFDHALLGVASIVLDYGGDEEMAIAALLHDAVEDQGGRPMLKIIEQIFGPRVAKIVDGCTDSYVEDPKKKEGWEQRKFRYLRRVRHEDAETRFVSAADKLYNVRAVLRDLRYNGDLAFARFSAPKTRIIWYYRSLVNEYRSGGVTHLLKPLLDDLDRVVVEVEHLSGFLAASTGPHRKLTTKLKGKR